MEFKVSRRAQRGVNISDRTRNVMIQTQSELYNRAKGTQTQALTGTAGSSTTSTGEKEEIVQADAIVQTCTLLQKPSLMQFNSGLIITNLCVQEPPLLYALCNGLRQQQAITV